MKIVLLSPASSIHTIRWANGLAKIGINVHLISQHPLLEAMHEKVTIHILPFRGALGYFTMVPAVKKLLKEIKPDLVNAHYASGYGTTARLANYHPWLLSVWGSDVYDFPYKSPIHKYIVRSNLLSADHIASTSHCMSVQTNSLVNLAKQISITPFGVDMNFFSKKCSNIMNDESTLVVGTVKTMSDKYGIDTLIKAFSLLLKNLSSTQPELVSRLKLRLVGGGPKTEELKLLAKDEGVEAVTEFVGFVDHSMVVDELLKLDVYVALSRWDSESFGVAIIEAGAAGKPVVVSDVGGLPEVVIDEETGFVVPKENPEMAALAIEKLLVDRELRLKMGAAGQLHVNNTYDWAICLSNMQDLYSYVIKNCNGVKK